jgi:replicative DNA helicase
VIPHDLDSERHVLGIMMLTPNATGDAAAMLRVDDFYSPSHQEVFLAAVDVWREGARPDPALVAERLRRRGQGQVLDGLNLGVLMAAAPNYDVLPYARMVADVSTRRRLQKLADELTTNAGDMTVDIAEAVSKARQAIADVEVPSLAVVDDVWDLDEYCAVPDDEVSWVVPGLLDQSDRTIIVAPEGMGKSVLMRQIAVMAGQGIHPFTLEPIPKVRTLLVDLENPPRILKSKTRPMLARVKLRGQFTPGQTFIWHRPGGIDLRSRAGAGELASVCRQVQPHLVCLGPLYKAYRADSSKRDHDVASEVAYVFDDLRTRFGFSLVLEHHAPLKQGTGARELRPFGSLLWTQWPEVGIKLIPDPDDKNVLNIGTWRGSRDERPWPARIRRGGDHAWPWMAEYDEDFRRLTA